MKPNHALLLLLLPMTTGMHAKDNGVEQNRPDTQGRNVAPTPATTLTDQLKAITSSETMNHKSQAKLISSTVRLAVITVTQGVNDPEKAMKIALDLATAAGKAAPLFADVIADAISHAPTISRIAGASLLIEDAVRDGKNETDETETAFPERNSHREREGKHEFGGPCVDPVSPSGPRNASSSNSDSGTLTIISSGGAATTAIGSK